MLEIRHIHRKDGVTLAWEAEAKEVMEAVAGAIVAQDFLTLERLFARISPRSFGQEVNDAFVLALAVADPCALHQAAQFARNALAMAEAGRTPRG